MSRPTSLLFALLLVACGDDGAAVPDAPIVVIDAPAPDTAPVCGAPSKMCGTACLPVTEDETNCGDCGIECKGGEACEGTCMCPPATFIPALIEPTQFDQFQAAGSITIAIAPTFGEGNINPILIGFDVTATPLDTDIDLATVPMGDPPFVAAAYGFDLGTMTTDAAYKATVGTLRLTQRCATEIEGTVTGATFQGVNGGLTAPEVDPLGCTITVPTITFHVSTAACP